MARGVARCTRQPENVRVVLDAASILDYAGGTSGHPTWAVTPARVPLF